MATTFTPLGPLVLAGSGEYTSGMDRVDSWLVERCKGTVLLIATSCAQEGADVMTRWEQMGVKHFAKFGVEATPLRIVDHADANKAENAERIAEAAIVWFSGGSPPYLAASFHQTASWEALEAANRRGTAVAGSSGGLGVLNDHVDAAVGSGPNAQQYMNLRASRRPTPWALRRRSERWRTSTARRHGAPSSSSASSMASCRARWRSAQTRTPPSCGPATSGAPWAGSASWSSCRAASARSFTTTSGADAAATVSRRARDARRASSAIMPAPDASLAGEDFCYITTTGRVTGKPHTIEIWFALHEGVLYILTGGSFRSDTVRNLQKQPGCRVKLGDVSHDATARLVSDADEDVLARRLLLEKYRTLGRRPRVVGPNGAARGVRVQRLIDRLRHRNDDRAAR